MSKTTLPKIEIRDGIIWIPEVYNETAATIREATHRAGEVINRLRKQGKPTRVRLELSSAQNTHNDDRRAAMRELLQLPFDSMTITGTKRETMPVLEFMISSLGRSSDIKISASNAGAMAWQIGKQQISVLATSNIAAIIAGVGGAVSCIGYGLNVTTMRTLGLGGKPMSISSALTFILLALVIIAHRRKLWRVTLVTATLIMVLGALGIVSLVLTKTVGLSLPKDTVMSALSSVLFILYGIFFIWPERWGMRLGRLPIIVAVVTTLAVFIAYLYDITSLTTLNLGSGISYASALLFALVGIFLLLSDDKTMNGARDFITTSTVTVVILLIGVQGVTAVSWRQANTHLHDQASNAFEQQTGNIDEAITTRLGSYINVLYGMRSFFHASDNVSSTDFTHYISNLNVDSNYPGFTAFTYIKDVMPSQKAAYIAALKQADGPAATIYPAGTRPEYFPVTYLVSKTNSKAYGFDLGSDPVRLSGLVAARASGNTIASDTIDLNASNSNTAIRPGFFITVPLYGTSVPAARADRLAQSTGFVNAYFEYKTLFRNDLANINTNVHVELFDGTGSTAKSIYASGPAVTHSEHDPLMTRTTITTAGKKWVLAVTGPSTFGTSDSDRSFPGLVLIAGNALDLFLLLYIAFLIRGRVTAVRLAERMTVDLKHERDQAIEQRGKDEAILSSIGDGVFALDTEGTIIIFNEAATSISGFTAIEAIGHHYRDILDFRIEATKKPHYEFIVKALSGKKAFMSNSTVLTHADGHKVPVADSAAPIRGANGEILGAIVVFRDVTKEHEIEQAKDEFVSLASHQLRTPATGVKQFLGMIREGYAGKLTKEQTSMIEDAYLSNERQLNIIEDMLSVARVDAGRIVLERATTDINAMVKDIVSEQMSVIQGRSQTITVDLPKAAVKGEVDEHRLRMVVENLVSNASKYTPEGGKVAVSVRKAEEKLVISVSDSGVGIAEADMPKLFGKFSRISNPLSTKVGGSGLGLYLAKRIIDLHHGTIEVVSTAGSGTTFTITLPS